MNIRFIRRIGSEILNYMQLKKEKEEEKKLKKNYGCMLMDKNFVCTS